MLALTQQDHGKFQRHWTAQTSAFLDATVYQPNKPIPARVTVRINLMRRWKAILTYDGTPYNGWQIQPGHPTIQGALAESLHHITGETTLPQGAGRTDTGVHALAQVAHFDLTCNIPPENLHRALNRSLPPSIRVLTLACCPPGFHARHSALAKTYEYRILPRPLNRETICPPFLAPYLWPYPYPLHLNLLNEASIQILGTHDFTSFAAINPDQSTRHTARGYVRATTDRLPHPPRLDEGCACSLAASPLVPDRIMAPPQQTLPIPRHRFRDPGEPASRTILQFPFPSTQPSSFRSEAEQSAFRPATEPTSNTRTIHASTWTVDDQNDPAILRYRITGSGFLHHMVRNLVGTFVECGAGRLHPEEIAQILEAKKRQAAGPTAPPQGLFLTEVLY